MYAFRVNYLAKFTTIHFPKNLTTTKDIPLWGPNEATAITMGSFDGVHLGHVAVIHRLVTLAQERGLSPTVLSFDPHPRTVLKAEQPMELLHTQQEKSAHLEALGLAHLVLYPFTPALAQMPARQYVEQVLVGELKAALILVGYDHRFGVGGQAGYNELISWGPEFGIEVVQIEAQNKNGVPISSSQIRADLKAGLVAQAKQALGYPYPLSARVIPGKKLGRTLGFPTANLAITDPLKLIPGQGVYLVQVTWQNQRKWAMANIGTNPTVDGFQQHIEAHIFDLDQDLYGQEITLHFEERLRDEKKFDHLDSLKSQLTEDKKHALALIQQVVIG